MFGIALIFSILSSRALYADGSNWFISALRKGTFMETMPGRVFSIYFFQLPLVMALKLGVTNLAVLRVMFGIGCFLPFPLVMVVCWRLSPDHFWVIILTCAAGYLNACFNAVSESIVAHAFFWPAAFALLFVRPLTPFAAGALLVSAMILVSSYESLLFRGPPLAVLSLWRGTVRDEGRWRRWSLLLAAGLFTASALLALHHVRHTPMRANLAGFKYGVRSEMFHPSWTVAWSIAWSLLIVARSLPSTLSSRIPHRYLYAALVCAFAPVLWMTWWLELPRFLSTALALFLATTFVLPELNGLLRSRIGRWTLGCALLVWGLSPVLWPANLEVGRQYYARFLNLAVPLGLLPVAFIAARKPKWLAQARNTFVCWGAAFLMAQSLWHLAATWQWQGYVALWRTEQTHHVGPVKISDTMLEGKSRGGQALRFDWWWADPSLSIALSSAGEVPSLIVPANRPTYQPFDPFNPCELPGLERYGIHFGSYTTALARAATDAPAKSASSP